MTSRTEVFAVLDAERDYQDAKWGDYVDHPHSLTEYLVYMRDYVEEALHLLSRTSDSEVTTPVLTNMRKITALGVAAMEQHGVEPRTP